MSGNIKEFTIQILSVVVVTALGFASFAHGQQAVQWRTQDGGNGHWYRYDGETQSRTTAQSRADAVRGYLVTITSPEEYLLLRAAFPSIASNMFWMGGYQTPGACEPGCGWHWLTGEPWSYVNWAAGEPNNVGGEPWLGCFADGRWNDFHSGWSIKSIIEWSEDCDDDGQVDYGQILDGTRADTDGNGFLDCCEAGVSCDPCLGDLNDSRIVDAEDLASILFAWGTDGGKTPEADINRDGTIDANDLSVVLGSWGACP